MTTLHCSPDDCVGVFPPQNGSFGTCMTNGSLAHSEACTFACNSGYVMRGPQPKCVAGSFLSDRKCIPKNCSGLVIPRQGSWGNCTPDGNLTHETSCNFECDTNYTLIGIQPNCILGQLSAPATCVPDVDCHGSWPTCRRNCADIVYNITTEQSGSGLRCPSKDGDTATCAHGDGNCTGECDSSCECGWGECEEVDDFDIEEFESGSGSSSGSSSSSSSWSESDGSSSWVGGSASWSVAYASRPRLCQCKDGYLGGRCTRPPNADVDCIGQWSECSATCRTIYNVTLRKYGFGVDCGYEAGFLQPCSSGAGQCNSFCNASSCGLFGVCRNDTSTCECHLNFTGVHCTVPPACLCHRYDSRVAWR